MSKDFDVPMTPHAAQQENPVESFGTEVPQTEPIPHAFEPLDTPDQDVIVHDEIKTEETEPEQTKQVMVDDVIREFSDAVALAAEKAATNMEKMGISIPLSTAEQIYRLKMDEFLRLGDGVQEVLKDMTSSIQRIAASEEQFTSATTLMGEALKKLGDNITESLKENYKGLGDSNARVHNKHQDQKVVELSGQGGLMTMTCLTGGVRRLTLWNSGITLSLRALPLSAINEFYREINHEDYEYGKTFGAFYYFFADLLISTYIIETLLPQVITGSNYTHWRDTTKLREAISWQDFHTILWGMGCMMHPTGATINFVCAEEGCGHIHSETADLTKLRLINTELITDAVVDHFKKGPWVNDEDLEAYRKAIGLNRSIEFVYPDDPHGRKWKVNLKQASLADYLEVGADYNAELRRHHKGDQMLEISQYNIYNSYRSFKPWIESIEVTVGDGDTAQTFVAKNNRTEDNDRMIYILLEDFQQNSQEFGDLMKDYILSTKITHICFYFPECPKCHTEPVNSFHGYLPYDPMQAFFTLALLKLLQVASKSTTTTTSSSTTRS